MICNNSVILPSRKAIFENKNTLYKYTGYIIGNILMTKVDSLNAIPNTKHISLTAKPIDNGDVKVFLSHTQKTSIDELNISNNNSEVNFKEEKTDNKKKWLIGAGIALGAVAVSVVGCLLFKKFNGNTLLNAQNITASNDAARAIGDTLDITLSRAGEPPKVAFEKVDDIVEDVAQSSLDKIFDKHLVLDILPENIIFKEAESVEEGVRFAKEVLKIPQVDDKFSLEAINFVNKSIVDVSNTNKGKLFLPKSLVYDALDDFTYAAVNRTVDSGNFAQLAINSKYFDESFLSDKIMKCLKIDGQDLFILDREGKSIVLKDLLPTEEFVSLSKRFFSEQPLTTQEKRKLCYSLDSALSKIRSNPKVEIGLIEPKSTVYHEMGHLQDFLLNLKETQDYDNRYITKTLFENMYSFIPDELRKSVSPTNYEFFYDESVRNIVGQVSNYSKVSIGEFVAEVYSGLISGKKFSPEVMTLYKKYNGPIPGTNIF